MPVGTGGSSGISAAEMIAKKGGLWYINMERNIRRAKRGVIMPIPSNVENLQRFSAKNIIYQTVCDWIITGVLRPGEKIVDSELAKRFNVSRTPVREAIQILEGQKLVYVVPGRATVVADIDTTDIEKYYRTLAELQALAAELACGSITDQELEQLEKTHRAFVDACDRNDGAGAIDHDNLFHETIVRAARNEYVEESSRTMILHIQRIKYHYFHCDRMRKISVSQHGEILRTIQARDGAKAKELMRSHWICSMENSLRDIAGSMQGHGGELGADVLTK